MEKIDKLLGYSPAEIHKIVQQWPAIYLSQWFSNFLHPVPPLKISVSPSTTIVTHVKIK